MTDTKIYDGTITSSKTPTVGGLYGGNTVANLAQEFASKNVVGAGGSVINVTGYTINDGDRGRNYSVTTLAATGTINPAPLTVQANNVSAVYGAALPAVGYTIIGFAGGDNLSVVSGEPLLATTATAGSDAGTYPITIKAGTLSAVNYDFPGDDLIGGTLTVVPAPLLITAESTSMVAGQAVPALTAVYAGFVNGDTPANLTPPPLLHSAVTPSSAGRLPDHRQRCQLAQLRHHVRARHTQRDSRPGGCPEHLDREDQAEQTQDGSGNRRAIQRGSRCG